MKRKEASEDLFVPSFKSSGGSKSLDSRDAIDNKSKFYERNSEETEDGEDRDDDIGFDNILRDMIPGVKVKVVKVTAPEKVDRDIISKVIEQIIDEEEEEKDYDIESVDTDDEIKSENDDEHSDTDLDSGSELAEEDEQHQIALQVVVGDGFLQRFSRGAHGKDLLRVPARLEKKGRMAFTFTVEEDANEHLSGGDGQSAKSKRAKLPGQRSIDNVMLDFVKSIGKGKIPMKVGLSSVVVEINSLFSVGFVHSPSILNIISPNVQVLKDVGELINLTLNQARNSQPLSGSTTFSRIDVSSSSDPLNGLPHMCCCFSHCSVQFQYAL